MVKKLPYRILHLEDDKLDVEMLQEILNAEGITAEFDVVTYKAEYLEKLNTESYSLIICDYSLPDFDGITALIEAKKIKPKTPFIIFSGTIGEEKAVDCIKLGADDYILKSNTTRLVVSVNRALKESGLIASNLEIKDNLMKSEARFKAIYKTALDGIITIDHKGTIIDVNKSFQRIFGFEHLQVIGKQMNELIIPERYREKYRQGIVQYLKTGESKILGKQLEMSALNSDGIEFPIEITIQVISPGKNPVFSAFIQDISLRKEAEDKIKSINEELEQKVKKRTKDLRGANIELSDTLNKLKMAQNKLVQSEKMASLGQLTAGIAHEINNPINFVVGGVAGLEYNFYEIEKIMKKYDSLEINGESDNKSILSEIMLMKSECEYDKTKELIPQLIGDIKLGAQRTVEIVKGLRAFSRIDTNERVATDIHEGLESTLSILQSKFKYVIEIEKHYDPLLPLIDCYPGQINQVFMNIISNAIDAIEKEGKITITTKNLKKNISINITDNGKGIPKEIQNNIFDPFFTTKKIGSGTGLGLSISYGIIEEHKGNIKVKSEEGKGSEFIIFIPKNN